MDSDHSSQGHRSRRRKHDDEGRDDESRARKRRHHDRDDRHDRDKVRRRSRSRSTHRERRARSRTPGASERPRSQDRDQSRERARAERRARDRDAPRDKPNRSRSPPGGSDRDGGKDRKRDKDSSRTHRRRRNHRSSRSPSPSSDRRRDNDDDDKKHYKSERRRADTKRQQARRRRSPSADKDAFSKKPSSSSSRAVVRQSGPLPDQDATFAVSTGLEPEAPKEQPNFRPSGTLAAAANAVSTASGETVTLKYHEPPEARKPAPRDRWKLFVFKGDAVVDTIELSGRSCWLVGREAAVVDLPAEHPSVSKQHAVVQFRYTERRNEYGDRVGKVKPYLIDLESANGTVLNGDKVPDSRYLELRDKDVVKFGLSTREYVFMLDRA